jgi:CheY-like chemotaxis protein
MPLAQWLVAEARQLYRTCLNWAGSSPGYDAATDGIRSPRVVSSCCLTPHTGRERFPVDSSKDRIVVVDDVSDTAEALAAALEANGYSVKIATDGVRALALVEEFRPLCVLLDIDMPGLTGIEVASLLRSRHGLDIVLIAVTGWGKADDRVSNAFNDFDHYLRKPFDPQAVGNLFNA